MSGVILPQKYRTPKGNPQAINISANRAYNNMSEEMILWGNISTER
jgi:hypothetical protein